MATHALDIATIIHALKTLEIEFLGLDRVWGTKNPEQKHFFEWYHTYKELIDQVTGLKAKASTDYQELNSFLIEERFAPMFRQFNGIGVASVLDKFVKWLIEGTPTDLRAQNRHQYPAFNLEAETVDIFNVDGYSHPLAILRTQSEDTLFLMMADKVLDELEIVAMIFDILARDKSPHHQYAGAIIPKVDFDIEPDISWLCNANTSDQNSQYWFVSQAFQQFKFRMNEKGARARVVTGIVMMKGVMTGDRPKPLVFDRPFYGFFLQNGIPIPLACFYSDYDSWQEPAGSLEDL